MKTITISTENEDIIEQFIELAKLCGCSVTNEANVVKITDCNDATSDFIEQQADSLYTNIESNHSLSKKEKEELIAKALTAMLEYVSEESDNIEEFDEEFVVENEKYSIAE